VICATKVLKYWKYPDRKMKKRSKMGRICCFLMKILGISTKKTLLLRPYLCAKSIGFAIGKHRKQTKTQTKYQIIYPWIL